MSMRPLKRVAKVTRDRAIDLRKQATHPEKLLWSILSSRQLAGLKFRDNIQSSRRLLLRRSQVGDRTRR
jgi:very-short-patch-repair endonuclease